jgi:Uma2 family endonuclease
MSPLTLSDEQFYHLCQNNRELKFERTAKGELIIMSPVGSCPPLEVKAAIEKQI